MGIGLEIQKKHPQYDSGQGFILSLHVGVGCGQTYALVVGGVKEKYEFLVIGEPFLQLKTVVDNSKSGEVVVSPQAWELVKSKCKGEKRESDWLVKEVQLEAGRAKQPQEELVLEDDKEFLLRCFISEGVLARLDSLQMSW